MLIKVIKLVRVILVNLYIYTYLNKVWTIDTVGATSYQEITWPYYRINSYYSRDFPAL